MYLVRVRITCDTCAINQQFNYYAWLCVLLILRLYITNGPWTDAFMITQWAMSITSILLPINRLFRREYNHFSLYQYSTSSAPHTPPPAPLPKTNCEGLSLETLGWHEYCDKSTRSTHECISWYDNSAVPYQCAEIFYSNSLPMKQSTLFWTTIIRHMDCMQSTAHPVFINRFMMN